MYTNIQTFSFSNIDKYSTAGLITRLTTDVTNLQNAYQMILRMCTRAPASLICAMVMAFLINAKLASIYLVAVIFLGGCLVFIMQKATVYFQAVFRKYDDLNASVQENIGAVRVVKAYVREGYEISKFQKACNKVYEMFLSAEKIVVMNMPLMQFTVYACILGISWLGAKMIVGSSLTTGELMSLLTYCMNILMSLMMLSMVFVMVTMSIASAERVTEVINDTADITDPEDPVTDVPDGSIVFDHVNFSYKKDSQEPVLKDINISIRSGETIGIIGGTGSAKSSLVNLISRLYDVTDGSVSVGGIDVRKYHLESLRNQVSVVLQKNVLFSGTILENLRWGDKNATEEECRRACQLACADDFIEKMPDKYNTFIEQGGSNVSGGQKQRLCIARALLKKPKILILDDSTSAVDTATDARIRRAFAEEIPDTTKLIMHSVFPASRMRIGSSLWITGRSTVLVPTRSFLRPTPFIRKYFIHRPAVPVILTREVSRLEKTEHERPGRSSARKGDGNTGTAGKLLGRLARYIFKNYSIHIVIVVICIFVSVLANVQGTMFMKTLIDQYITPLLSADTPDFGPLAAAIARVACFYAIGVIATYTYNRIMINVSQGTLRNLRNDMFATMETLPIKYFDTHAHGDIMSIYTNDIDTLRQMISQSFPQLLSSVITIVSVLVSMLILNVPLTVVTLLMVAIMMTASRKLAGLSGKYFLEQQTNLGIVNGYIEEMMEGQKVVKVFCHEDESIRKFDELNDQLFTSADNANRFANILMPVVAQLGNVSYVICAMVGGILAINGIGSFTLGGLASFLTFNKSFNMLSTGQPAVQQYCYGSCRCKTYL